MIIRQEVHYTIDDKTQKRVYDVELTRKEFEQQLKEIMGVEEE